MGSATAGRSSAGTVRGVETFAAGKYDGDAPGEVWEYTPADIATIARNFALLSKGESPLHRVPVVQTHDEVHAYGWVSDARDERGLLLTDWEDVAPELRRKLKEKRLRKVSAEIKQDFTTPDGKVYPGPYLYRVSVLGADVPRVKGLADVPATFADRQPGRKVERVFRACDGDQPVTKEDAVAFLTSMGIDPAMLEGAKDELLIAVASAWQAEDGTDGDQMNHADATNPPANQATPPKKVTVTQQFADPRAVRRMVQDAIADVVAAETKKLRDAADEERRAREQRAAAERVQSVRMFCDQRAGQGKLSPAENDEISPLSVRSRLVRLAAQPQTVQKFADPADKTRTIEKTELQLQQDEIDAREPRRFSERVRATATAGGAQATDSADPLRARLEGYYAKQIERHQARTGRN